MEYLRNLPTDNACALAGMIQIRPGQVVSMAFSRAENCQMTLLAVAEGESISEESYLGDTFYYVLEGEMSLRIPEGLRVLGAGECLAVPARTLHALGGGKGFKLLQIILSGG